MTKTAYAAIRKTSDSGREWICFSSLSLIPEETELKIAETKEDIPGWDRANPVVRIVKVVISEVEE